MLINHKKIQIFKDNGILFDWYWNRIWPMLQTENKYNIDNGGCRIQGCIFTISSWKAPLQSKIYTPGGKTVLTVSILGVSRFHLKRVMHLEHGQMSQRGQSRTRQHSLADKIRTGNKTLYIQHRYERDFFFLKISIWNFCGIEMACMLNCFSSLSEIDTRIWIFCDSLRRMKIFWNSPAPWRI